MISRGTALVTGGAKRIGKAICLDLASSGYAIALQYNHSKREAEKTAQYIQNKGGVCQIFQSDFAVEEQSGALVESVVKKMKRVNVLINNASIFEKSSLRVDETQSLDQHFAVNFKAPCILTNAFVHRCKKGQVINILDTNITKNQTQYNTYLLSKKALHAMTQQAAVALAPQIRVNAVAPGLILPPSGQKNDYLERLAKRIPLRKKGQTKHVTQAIQFFLENDYVTGQVIFVDGGEHLI